VSLFDRIAEQRETKDGGITAGVFIPLPKSLAKQFPNKDEFDDSDPHVTMLYVGDVTPEQQARLTYEVAKIAAYIKPFQMDMGSYGEFQNPEGQTIAHMAPTASHPHGLSALHVALWRAADAAGVPVSHRYGDYVAGLPDAAAFKSHATLAYMPAGETYKGPKPAGAWTCTELEVWGHQKDKIQLGSALTEERGRNTFYDYPENRTEARVPDDSNCSRQRCGNLATTMRKGAWGRWDYLCPAHDPKTEMRDSCLDCTRKHLSQALVLATEARQGYAAHRWIVIGHMGEAADESVKEYPALAAEIRKHRLAYMKDKDYVIPFMKLIEKASALTEDSIPRLISQLQAINGKATRTAGDTSTYRRLSQQLDKALAARKGKKRKTESSDFPSKYASPAAASNRTGVGTAPIEDPGNALVIVQDGKKPLKRPRRVAP